MATVFQVERSRFPFRQIPGRVRRRRRGDARGLAGQRRRARKFGPNTYDVTFIGFDCGDFDIEISGQGTDRVTVFFDAAGDADPGRRSSARFPHDVLTNT